MVAEFVVDGALGFVEFAVDGLLGAGGEVLGDLFLGAAEDEGAEGAGEDLAWGFFGLVSSSGGVSLES